MPLLSDQVLARVAELLPKSMQFGDSRSGVGSGMVFKGTVDFTYL